MCFAKCNISLLLLTCKTEPFNTFVVASFLKTLMLFPSQSGEIHSPCMFQVSFPQFFPQFSHIYPITFKTNEV